MSFFEVQSIDSRTPLAVSSSRVIAMLLLAACVQAQQPVPARGGNIDRRIAGSQQTSTIQVRVRRVVLDVTVTDAKGKPVWDLTQDDFQVSEDGTAQTVRSFEVHTAEPQPPLKLPRLPANTFSNLTSAPAGGPTTVILDDLLNTPLDSQAYAHQQLLDFLKQGKQAGQVAIFVLSDKLHMLQGFTDDDNKLVAALNYKKAKGYRSGLLQTPSQTQDQTSAQLSETDGNQNGADARQDTSFQSVSAMLRHMETTESAYLLDRRVELTAQALQQIALFLVSLPGRKNLLWLSGSFPAGVIPNSDVNGRDAISGRDAFANTRNYNPVIVQATAMLNLSHVAVYPVDARGLQGNGMFSAASRQTFEPGQGKDSQAVRNFTQQLAAEHSTMDTIATETGGRAFYNTNGLKEAAADAAQEGSIYYTISYTPTSPTDDQLRKVRVDIKQPGLRLAYRHSYFASSLDEVASKRQDPSSPKDTFAATLEHGVPATRQLFFEAHVLSEGVPVAATPEQMRSLIHYEGLMTKNKRKQEEELEHPLLLQRYIVEFVLLPRQLDLKVGSDQARRDDLELAAVSYNDDGLTLNGIQFKIQDVIKPERWSAMQESGYHIPMAIFVPTQAHFLRLAVRDASNDHMGSLELSLPLAAEPVLPSSAPVTPNN